MKPARALRVLISVLCAVAVTATAAGATSVIMLKLNIVADIQIGWLLATMQSGAVITWFALTYLFGRFYCSSVCPLGTLQDVCARSLRSGRKRAERFRYAYTPPQTRLRLVVLAFFIVALIVAPAMAAKLEPSLLYDEAIGSLAGHLLLASTSSTVITYTIILIVAVTSVRSGRVWCNTLCPTGTALGLVSEYSLLHFDINTDLCTNCRKCVDICKAQCINLDDHTVDNSRCVVCFDCTAVCRDGAITYTTDRHKLSTPMMTKI